MHRLRFLEKSLNAEIEVVPTTIHALLTRGFGEPTLIQISGLLDQARQLSAAATMLHVLARNWAGRQHAFMFPRDDDGPEALWHLAFARRVYRGPFRDGLRTLMPDAWMERQEREEVEPRVSAEEAGVSLADYVMRTMDWQAHRAPKVKELRADVAWLCAHKYLKRASEIPPRPKPRPGLAKPITDRALLPLMADPSLFTGPPAPEREERRGPSLLDPLTRGAVRAALYREMYGALRLRAGRFD